MPGGPSKGGSGAGGHYRDLEASTDRWGGWFRSGTRIGEVAGSSFEESCEIVAATDPLTRDEDLWGRRDLVLGLEGIDLLRGCQDRLLDVEAMVFQQAI